MEKPAEEPGSSASAQSSELRQRKPNNSGASAASDSSSSSEKPQQATKPEPSKEPTPTRPDERLTAADTRRALGCCIWVVAVVGLGIAAIGTRYFPLFSRELSSDLRWQRSWAAGPAAPSL